MGNIERARLAARLVLTATDDDPNTVMLTVASLVHHLVKRMDTPLEQTVNHLCELVAAIDRSHH